MGGTRTAVVAAALALLTLPAGPVALADEHREEDKPVFVRQDVWFHQAEQRVSNLHGDPFGDELPSWNATKPTVSHPLGAGAVYAANPYAWFTTQRGITRPHDPRSGPTFAGTATGDLENMAVELYAYMPVNHVGITRLPAAFAFDLRIDDMEVLYQPETAPSYGIPVEKLNGDGLYRIRFVFTNLYRAMKELGMEVADDKVHEIHLNLTTFYVGTECVFVYDSAEAPAGAIFNLVDDPIALSEYMPIDVFDPPPPYGGAGLPRR